MNTTKCLRQLLPLCLLMQFSFPVQAHNPIGGSSTSTNTVLDNFLSNTWTTIRSVNINVPDAGPTHRCVAMASVDALNPGGNGNAPQQLYDFGLGLDISEPTSDSLQTVELRNDPDVNDPDRWPVSTNRTFNVGAGNHTIFFLGRVRDQASPDLTMDNAALSVFCNHDSAP